MNVIAWSQNLTADAARYGRVHGSSPKRNSCGKPTWLRSHVILSSRTTGLIGAPEFALMKPSARLVNYITRSDRRRSGPSSTPSPRIESPERPWMSLTRNRCPRGILSGVPTIFLATHRTNRLRVPGASTSASIVIQ